MSYSVAYAIALLYDPTRAVSSGSRYSIKLQLRDAGGSNVSAKTIIFSAGNDPVIHAAPFKVK